jgi:hypothetical protein
METGDGGVIALDSLSDPSVRAQTALSHGCFSWLILNLFPKFDEKTPNMLLIHGVVGGR